MLNLWILHENSGKVLFKRVFEEKMDSDLFGSTLCALNMMAGQISGGGLKSFHVMSQKFMLVQKNDLMFVGNFTNDFSVDHAQDELVGVASKFFKCYSQDVIKNWQGDELTFKDFEEFLDDDPVELPSIVM